MCVCVCACMSMYVCGCACMCVCACPCMCVRATRTPGHCQTHRHAFQLNPGAPGKVSGPSPAPVAPVPNLAASLLMTCCTRGLFWYLEMLAGFVATSWNAAETSGS